MAERLNRRVELKRLLKGLGIGGYPISPPLEERALGRSSRVVYSLGVESATQIELISVQGYLEAEKDSPVKHEYLGGVVYAMSGGRNVHNRVASNILGALWSRLRGQSCQPFNSDTKIRIRLPSHTRFYYPDVSVVCRPNPAHDVFHDEPSVVVEVLSDSTRRTDTGEKQEAYLSIPTLAVYLLVEPETAAVVVFRRTDQGFVREVWEGLGTNLPLPEIGVELPLSEIYGGVETLQ